MRNIELPIATKLLYSKPSMFSRIMALYADNYWRLILLFNPVRLSPGHYQSQSSDGMVIDFKLLEKHPYTLELKISYEFLDDETAQPDPSAHVRIYLDARMAEVTTCFTGQRIEDALGRHAPQHTILAYRLRMNTFLNKWLHYLGEQGHSQFSLKTITPHCKT